MLERKPKGVASQSIAKSRVPTRSRSSNPATRSPNLAPAKSERFGTKMSGSHMTKQAVGAVGTQRKAQRAAGLKTLGLSPRRGK